MKINYRLWGLLFLFSTLVGLLNFAIIITSEYASYSSVKWIYPFVNEMTGAYSGYLVLPLMLLLFKKLPLKKDNASKYLPIYLFASLIIGITHTMLMWGSRTLFYPILDLGEFNYGDMRYRFIMEYLKQFLWFWITFGAFRYFISRREREEQRIKTIQLEELLTKTKLESLQAQLNPHFLFNTLNMISSIMYEDIQSADKMIANLSALLRISLKNTNQNGIVFASELEILNLYLEIMKERFKDKLDVTLEIDDNLLEVKVPPFLFQPIVENSIKHGMENLSKLVLSIKAEIINDYAIVYIEDNGKGIEENSLKLTGVGLSNIAERLKKTFCDDYEFVWKNKVGGGLITKIVFPIK